MYAEEKLNFWRFFWFNCFTGIVAGYFHRWKSQKRWTHYRDTEIISLYFQIRMQEHISSNRYRSCVWPSQKPRDHGNQRPKERSCSAQVWRWVNWDVRLCLAALEWELEEACPALWQHPAPARIPGKPWEIFVSRVCRSSEQQLAADFIMVNTI